MIRKLLCIVISHDLHNTLVDKCIQVQICQRCGYKQPGSEQEVHDFGEWEYEKPGFCKQVRFCKNCSVKQYSNQPVHHFGEWEYEKTDSCKQVRACKNCSITQNSSQPIHDWMGWKPKAGDPCSQIRVCQRCNVTGEHTEHDWIDNVISSQIRKEKIGKTPYHQGESTYNIILVSVIQSTCSRCGKTEERTEESNEGTEVI